MADFIGNIENANEFKEYHLRCTRTRDVRFVGKRIANVDGEHPLFGHQTAEIYVTLSGRYVAYYVLIRKDGSEFSKYAVCTDFIGIRKFFGCECGEIKLGKQAMIEAGIDDAVDIP